MASLLVAGSFMIGIVPYTLSLIVPLEVSLLAEEAKMRKMLQAGAEVNHGMNGKAEGGSSEENVTKTRSMIRRWAKLNYGRMILPLTGAVIVCIEYIRGE